MDVEANDHDRKRDLKIDLFKDSPGAAAVFLPRAPL
jgi:hypothetical protein